MTKILSSLLALISGFVLLVTPAAVLAQSDPLEAGCEQGAQNSSLCQDSGDPEGIVGPDGILTQVIQILTMIVGIAAVIMIIIGGLKYILSAGDSANTESAKNTILYAVIGLAIALAAQAIVTFVIRRL